MVHFTRLVFDSLTARPRPGLRGYAFSARQLLFSADSFDIDIELLPVGTQLSLLGQLLSHELPAEGIVQLCQPRAVSGTLPLTPQGEFHFVVTEPGSYQLRIELHTLALVTPSFTISL